MLISIFPIWFNSQHFQPNTKALVVGILASTGEGHTKRGVVGAVLMVVVGALCLEADVGNS